MIKIESIKDYTDDVRSPKFVNLSKNIFITLNNFESENYPNFKEWFTTKQMPEAINGFDREIFFIRNPENESEIISIACLKNKEEEKKICTLYVSEEYRHLGIDKSILEASMRYLDTTTPLITFPENKLGMFKPFIEKYDWKLEEIATGVYNDTYRELCFNGTLTKDKKDTLHK